MCYRYPASLALATAADTLPTAIGGEEMLLIFRHKLFQPLKDFSLSFSQLTSEESLLNTISRIAAHGTWQSKE